jgi:hypothetical protein
MYDERGGQHALLVLVFVFVLVLLLVRVLAEVCGVQSVHDS